jgi:hypothetical protein
MCDESYLFIQDYLNKIKLKIPFKLLYGEKSSLHDDLKIFGEVGVVTTKNKIQAKLINPGTTCMFIGYTDHHSRDVQCST